MTLSTTQEKKKDVTSDELLRDYRDNRNNAAFTKFWHLHEKQFFGTAKRITGCEHLAQEAVQEAAVAMVSKVGQYRGEGAVGWATKIVMTQSLIAEPHLKNAELASRLGKTVLAIKNHLHRARDVLSKTIWK